MKAKINPIKRLIIPTIFPPGKFKGQVRRAGKIKRNNLVLGDVGLDATDVRLSLIVLVAVCICLGDYPRISHPYIPLPSTIRAVGEEWNLL